MKNWPRRLRWGPTGSPPLIRSQFVARNTTRAPMVPKTRPRIFPLNRRIAPTRALSSGSPLFVTIAPLRTGIHRRVASDSRGVARFTEGDPGLRGRERGELLRPAVLASHCLVVLLFLVDRPDVEVRPHHVLHREHRAQHRMVLVVVLV